jgi:hypothetical protein
MGGNPSRLHLICLCIYMYAFFTDLREKMIFSYVYFEHAVCPT